jgi:hypothetical protein
LAEFLTANGGVLTRTIFEDGKIIQKRVQDERPYLDQNKALFNDAPGEFFRKPKLRMVASIPMVAYYEIVVTKMGIPPHRMFRLDDDERKKLNSYLNSNEYQYLRTSPGKL